MVPNKILDKLLKEVTNGNKKSLEVLYNETKSAVYGYILSILKNKSLAEEALQDTYIKIWENSYLYKKQDKPLAWIFTIAKNISLMKIRKEKNHSDIDDLKEILTINKTNIDDRLFLSYLFSNVSDEERNIVILHVISGFKHKEISQMLDIPLGTVLSKYKRTISKLKNIAKEDSYEG